MCIKCRSCPTTAKHEELTSGQLQHAKSFTNEPRLHIMHGTKQSALIQIVFVSNIQLFSVSIMRPQPKRACFPSLSCLLGNLEMFYNQLSSGHNAQQNSYESSQRKELQFGKICVPVLFNFSGMLLGKSLSR